MRGLLRAVAATLAAASTLAILAAGGGAAAGATPVRDPVIVVNGLFGAGFADGVRAQTGAAKVDLVGHSEGGLVSRTYVKYYGGAAEVDSLITLGTPNYGTVAANIARVFTLRTCVGIAACEQMTIGSSFLADLNAGDDSIGNVAYTNIATVFDELVQPYTNSFLNAADGNITNKSLQSQCWLRFVGHLGLILDGAVYSGVQDALEKRPISFSCFAL